MLSELISLGPRTLVVMFLCSLGSSQLAADERNTVSRLIDAEISSRLVQDKITPAPRADDITLLRRLYLDTLGRLPTVAETEAFLADSTPDKPQRLIDTLLVHPEMPVYWRKIIDGWLNGYLGRDNRGVGYPEYLDFLERSLAANKPWDQLVRQLLLPNPTDADQKGATYFIANRLNRSKEENLDHFATSVASGLFGVQMQCAKCHDHPFVDEWKQAHYYGIAAFFTRLERKPEQGLPFSERPDGEVKYLTKSKEERLADAMFFDSVVLDDATSPAKDGKKPPRDGPPANRRELLTKHALSPDSPYFKRSLVNRVWKQLLGRGLVEPVDQIHSANPASHPRLLDGLADDFAAHRFDLRRLLAGILHSETYQRASRLPGDDARPPAELYAIANLKPLSGDQLAWSLATSTGFIDQILLKWGKELKPAPEKGTLNPALRVRWEKEAEYDAIVEKFVASGDSFQANVSQALFLTFNPAVVKILQPAPNKPLAPNLADRLLAESDAKRRIELAYLAILARRPTAEEIADSSMYMESAGDLKSAVSDLVWALLNSPEFRFVH
ncbi:hypothetical protein ETAA8_16470 [Anatilimnocola aggregata]|uniref:DUF1553 domain-containing protein n=1 Tax=Anatilimnocola aggregata TaxID=2528021 RepID=A0A517Y8K0_9BACT|nr:DUF1549 domain-containing protein [Anatilimnocola aggregata]QDU26567.1 hypothetical protein ETAA8_16470 [Anatilimnocola aggregata]